MATNEAIDAGPLHDQTAFRRDVLAVIAANPDAAGLEIKAELDKLYDSDINHGRLYPNLDTLAEQGLISKGKHDDRTNSYSVTRRGERELRAHVAWLNEMAGD